MTEQEEAAYVAGGYAAWQDVLSAAMRHLDASDLTRERLVKERYDIVVALQSLLRDLGDNEWDDDLYLADVIEKRLRPLVAD